MAFDFNKWKKALSCLFTKHFGYDLGIKLIYQWVIFAARCEQIPLMD